MLCSALLKAESLFDEVWTPLTCAFVVRKSTAHHSNSIWAAPHARGIGATISVLRWRLLLGKMGEKAHSGEGNMRQIYLRNYINRKHMPARNQEGAIIHGQNLRYFLNHITSGNIAVTIMTAHVEW